MTTHPNLADGLCGVVRQAAVGALPPFALTLGMPRGAWSQLAGRQLFHDAGFRNDAPAADPPHLHAELVSMLLANTSKEISEQEAGWIAYAVASATYGRRHLWEDMGVAGREVVSALLQHYFNPLYVRNIHNLKWKRFLYDELGLHIGQASLQPSGCRYCNQYSGCYAPGAPGKHIALVAPIAENADHRTGE